VVATEWQCIVEDITKPRRERSDKQVNVIMAVTSAAPYCIVPSVRGWAIRMPSAIRAEMEQLGQLGYKVTLLGQNIDAYGRDLPGVTSEGRHQHTLTDLLYYVHDVRQRFRGWFATSHPRYFA